MLKRFLKSKSGATAIEYGLIAALIGAAIVGSVTNLGEENAINYDSISTEVTDAIK
jgi:pilus assembly protein Flp/PilA